MRISIESRSSACSTNIPKHVLVQERDAATTELMKRESAGAEDRLCWKKSNTVTSNATTRHHAETQQKVFLAIKIDGTMRETLYSRHAC